MAIRGNLRLARGAALLFAWILPLGAEEVPPANPPPPPTPAQAAQQAADAARAAWRAAWDADADRRDVGPPRNQAEQLRDRDQDRVAFLENALRNAERAAALAAAARDAAPADPALAAEATKRAAEAAAVRKDLDGARADLAGSAAEAAARRAAFEALREKIKRLRAEALDRILEAENALKPLGEEDRALRDRLQEMLDRIYWSLPYISEGPDGPARLADLCAAGRVEAAVTGTGETIGRVADLRVANLTGDPLAAVVEATVLESVHKTHQNYAIPAPLLVELAPFEKKTVPLDGVCLDARVPPAGPELTEELRMLDPRTPEFREKFQRPLARARRTIRAVEALQPGGFYTTPFDADPKKVRDTFVQWGVWAAEAEAAGRPIGYEEFAEAMHKQVPDLTPEVKEQMKPGIDQIWSGIQSTGRMAKLAAPDGAHSPVHGFPAIRDGAARLLQSSPEFQSAREALLPKVLACRNLPELEEAVTPLAQDPKAKAREKKTPSGAAGPPPVLFSPLPWEPAGGVEVVPRRVEYWGSGSVLLVNDQGIALRRAINKLWLMGFTTEAQQLRDLLGKSQISWNALETGKDNMGKVDSSTGRIYLNPSILSESDSLEWTAVTLLHELFHHNHHTGWGYWSNLGWHEAEIVGVGGFGENKRFWSREAKLRKEGKMDEIERKAIDSVKSE